MLFRSQVIGLWTGVVRLPSIAPSFLPLLTLLLDGLFPCVALEGACVRGTGVPAWRFAQGEGERSAEGRWGPSTLLLLPIFSPLYGLCLAGGVLDVDGAWFLAPVGAVL